MVVDPAHPARARQRREMTVLEAMRPAQWVKNAFVLAGVVFAGRVLDLEDVALALAMTLAFCLVSSGSYLINDALDAEADRHNPRTAGRPIARGDLAVRTALVAAGVLILASLAIGAVIGWEALAVLGGYLTLQIAYSKALKHMLFLDVMSIAAGFVLRVAGGIVAVGVPASPWILLATFLLAVFLGLMKRRAEVVAMGGSAQPRRAVLDHYSVQLVDELIAVVTPATLVVYCLYAVTGARSDAMLVTVPFVLYGIFRALYLVHHQSAMTEEPTVLAWRDRPLLICVVLWAITAAIVSVATS